MLTFKELSEKNIELNDEAFSEVTKDWVIADWSNALAGEVGEACNMIKKIRRGQDIDKTELGHELADVMMYLDLLATKLDIDLEAMIVEKFNEVSEKRGASVYLEEYEHDEEQD